MGLKKYLENILNIRFIWVSILSIVFPILFAKNSNRNLHFVLIIKNLIILLLKVIILFFEFKKLLISSIIYINSQILILLQVLIK